MERIKEAVRQRNLARRGLQAPQIGRSLIANWRISLYITVFKFSAKPIRPGQQHAPTPIAPVGIRGGGQPANAAAMNPPG